MRGRLLLIAWVTACAGPPSAGPSPSPSASGTPEPEPTCQTLPVCGLQTRCPESTSCMSVKGCATSVCTTFEIACSLSCGAGAKCVSLDSYPPQLECER